MNCSLHCGGEAWPSTRIAGDEDWRPQSLDEVRKVHIQKVLQMCNGNRLRAAQILGIGRTSLYR
jgi:ActR/RegA family two-component response regulator